MRRVGVLLPAAADNPVFQAWVGAFLQGLELSGWTIGRNVRIDIRWAMTMPEIFADTRRNWSRSRPTSSWPMVPSTVGPLLQATRTVPIVFPVAGDPVAAGYVDSLARPGGNVTGFMLFEYGLRGKWLELLKQIAPGITRAAVLRDPTPRGGTSQLAAVQAVAPSLRMEVNPVNMRDASEIERTIAAFAAVSECRSDRHVGPAARGFIAI